MGDVIRLDIPVPDTTVLEPDAVLEANKGKFQQLAIIGYDKDGIIALCSTHGSREVLWMLERAKHFLLNEAEGS